MRSNIDKARRALENRPETEQVTLDGDSSDVIIRALVDDVTDDFEQTIENLGIDITSMQYVGFGTEVEIR